MPVPIGVVRATRKLDFCQKKLQCRVDALVELSGVADGSTDLGTFPGDIIRDNATIYQALEDLEGAIDRGASPVGRTITIEVPKASEDITMFFIEREIYIEEVVGVVIGSGGPSVTITLMYGPDRTSPNTIIGPRTIDSTTTGNPYISGFTKRLIPARSFIWITSSATTGTLTELSVTMIYTTPEP